MTAQLSATGGVGSVGGDDCRTAAETDCEPVTQLRRAQDERTRRDLASRDSDWCPEGDE